MDGSLIRRIADAAAARMKREGIRPVEAVSAVYKEQYGGSFSDELTRAALAVLGRRGGKKAAESKKEAARKKNELLQRMMRDAELLALRRGDHLVPDP